MDTRALFGCTLAAAMLLCSCGEKDDTGLVDCDSGADELCGDGIDNDCDGAVDEPDAVDAALWYYDGDGDGYGDPTTTEVACTAPSYFVEDNTDCDDSDPDINPDTFWAPDADNDGFGDLDSSTWVQSCEQPSGYVLDATYCDDLDPRVNPGTGACGG